MSKSIVLFCALAAAALVSACGGQQDDEVVFVEPAPVVAEPTYSKY